MLAERPDFLNNDFLTARIMGPSIVTIGGGTGMSTMLRGLKNCTENLTAIVAMSDDGGSTGLLRQDLGMLPPGDVRNCILALSNTEPLMQELLNYRFKDGGLTGQCFGNLFLAALDGISPSFDSAVGAMCKVLAITGRVLPVTTENVYLEAEFENGAVVLGESKIFQQKKKEKCRIKQVRLTKENPEPLPEALKAIRNADMIVLGPGSLYTSIIPNLLVGGIADAICESSALKVYVMNVMTQEGETEGYTAYDHINALHKHTCERIFDVCLVNTERFPYWMLEKYKTESAEPIRIDYDRLQESGVEVIERRLVGDNAELARHDPESLSRELMLLHLSKHRRAGLFADFDRLVISRLFDVDTGLGSRGMGNY